MIRGTTEDPRFHRLARAVGGRLIAAGLVTLLIDLAGRFDGPSFPCCRDGGVGRYSNEEIAAFLDWEGSGNDLVATLIHTRWLEEVAGPSRLYVTGWHDALADRAVHMWLSREVGLFANGKTPKLSYLGSLRNPERRRIEEAYVERYGRAVLGEAVQPRLDHIESDRLLVAGPCNDVGACNYGGITNQKPVGLDSPTGSGGVGGGGGLLRAVMNEDDDDVRQSPIGFISFQKRAPEVDKRALLDAQIAAMRKSHEP